MVDILRWIGAGRRLVGGRDGDQGDVDLHVGLQMVAAGGGARLRDGEESRRRGQRLRDGERRRLMAIFALTEYAC